MEKKNIFIVGLEPFNLEKLERLPRARDYDFHAALEDREVRNVDVLDMPKLIDKAIKTMEEFDGSVDGVATYWDFPSSLMVAILARHFDLPGPSLESMFKCEHKYWSRLEQQKVAPEYLPMFRAFDPHDEDAFGKLQLMPPFWIKPIKSYRSFLAYQINDERQFHEVMKTCRERQDLLVKPFCDLLKQYEMPEEIVRMPETFVAESTIGGAQCTLEGYVYEGKVSVYGVVDSIRAADSSSFTRYEYPSSLPLEIQHRMIDIARLVVKQIGLDNSPFNIEFYYNQTSDNIWLLEINPRISQAHTDLFEKVHGISHHSVMLDLALGRKPNPLAREGHFNMAAHFMVRIKDSGRVEGVPSQESIDRLTEKQPGTIVRIAVEPGQHLSELHGQDMYSYEIAQVFIGGRDQRDLLEKYDEAMEALDFDIAKDEEMTLV
ncbi:MAG TPA: ATP-grasp domain-containing protein [Desulfuromonadales bacterium]|nr:ATP-grasp domain-containing protein [Desulfuromonadales bacterium]